MYIILLILDNILKLRNASKILSINFILSANFYFVIWLKIDIYINNMSIYDGFFLTC